MNARRKRRSALKATEADNSNIKNCPAYFQIGIIFTDSRLKKIYDSHRKFRLRTDFTPPSDALSVSSSPYL